MFCTWDSQSVEDTASTASSACTKRQETNDTKQQVHLTNADAVSSTYKWFQNIVLGQKLCPFAAPLVSNVDNKLRIVTSSASTPHQAATDVIHEALLLMRDESNYPHHRHETTLVVFDDKDDDDSFVKDFHAFVRLSWTLQEKAIVETGLEGELQLVLFHPKATHQTYGVCSDEDHPADYTIRSPYPTVHLLREQDVIRAVQSGYPHLEELPNRNKARFIEQGIETCQRRLAACYVVEKKAQ